MIRLENLYKSFGTQAVLNDISLSIKEGSTTAIVGPSGVGKSVLLKIITGIIHPDSGKVFIDGEEITSLSSEHERNLIREKIGVLFQAAALLDSLSIYENIAFPLVERCNVKPVVTSKEIHEKVCYMLESLSLCDVAKLLPNEVPIGTRKRCGLARALITEPKILLFDEPNTGLDPLVGQEVYDLIKECKKTWHFTGVVISHELPEVFQVSDEVVMLLNGQIRFQGTSQEFKDSRDPATKQFLNGEIDGPITIN